MACWGSAACISIKQITAAANDFALLATLAGLCVSMHQQHAMRAQHMTVAHLLVHTAAACCRCLCCPARYAKRKKAKYTAYAPEPDDAGLDYEEDDLDGSSGEVEEQQLRPGQRKQQQQQHRTAPVKQQQQQQQQRPGSSGGGKPQPGCAGSSGGSWQSMLGSDAPAGQYSEDVVRSLQLVDPSLIHYELIEALLLHIVDVQRQHGPAGLLKVRQAALLSTGSGRQPRDALATACHVCWAQLELVHFQHLLVALVSCCLYHSAPPALLQPCHQHR
jgi:hypothetical protein